MIDTESTAQIARINEMWRAKVMEALQDKELRKWCIERAISCDVRMADEIYKFITAPLADLLQEK